MPKAYAMREETLFYNDKV
jgi:maltose-binding protein MalE